MSPDSRPWNASYFPGLPQYKSPVCPETESRWLYFLLRDNTRISPIEMNVFGVKTTVIVKTVSQRTLLVVSSDEGTLDGALLHPDRPHAPLRTLYATPRKQDLETRLGTLTIRPETYLQAIQQALTEAKIPVGAKFSSNIITFTQYLKLSMRDELGSFNPFE